LALSIGLLIGLERGWHEREAPEGRRIAGIRTFGLIGLLGGLWALLGQIFGPVVLGIAFVTLAALLITAHLQDVRIDNDVGTTTVVASLVTFTLGALAVQGETTVAATMAVITMTLLSLKPVLHQWLRNLEARDLEAGIKLLLISVVVLSVLPNKGFGPWHSLNPYEIWWLVVLIAGISFAGYVAIKLAGARGGILLTGFLGGLVSSTATTLNLVRLKPHGALVNVTAGGIVLATATMFPRMLVEVAVVNISLLPPLLAPMLTMMFVAGICSLWLGRKQSIQSPGDAALELKNPLALTMAIQFGLLLAVVMLAAEGVRAWLGEPGLFLLAGISGIADVDAITLSLARMGRGDIDQNVVTYAIVLAAFVNTFVKGLIVAILGGTRLSLRVIPIFLAVFISGVLALAVETMGL